ncbi:MAG: hypothetical protein K8W52_43745, partial [Deltaproteobacteria bacterium]|nr:hypothetical protein [Deltaproteobacteria bacterium]
MSAPRRLAVLVAILGIASASRARAEHHHGGEPVPSAELGVRIAVSAIAARYDTGAYVGDYEGLALAVGFARGRFAVHAIAPVYRLRENGADRFGPGDLMVGGDAVALATGPWMVGGSVMAGAPTGDGLRGLGMGHAMAMAALWGRRAQGRFATVASVGYARAFDAESHHDHGAWPLVEPMNMAEVTGALGADATVARRWRLGARAAIAVATGAGSTRAIAAGGIRWVGARLEVATELQVGVLGD